MERFSKIKSWLLQIMQRNLYYKYIYTTFVKNFAIWLTAFTIVLFAMNYVEVENFSKLTDRLFITLIKTFESCLDILNIVCLLCCISYCFRAKNNFNFCVVQSFGVSSKQIIRPIMLFLLVFCLTKIFILKPLSLYVDNFKKNISKQSAKKEITLKSGTKFTIIDEIDKNNYRIINAVFVDRNKYEIFLKNAVVMNYANDDFVGVYSAKQGIIKNEEIELFNANYLNKTSNVENISNKTNIETLVLNSKLNVKSVVGEIKNAEKLKKSLYLGLYDHIRVIGTKNKNKNLYTDAGIQARVYMAEEIANIFIMFLCVLMAYLFCATNSRNVNIIKISISCFLSYFLISRISHQLLSIVYYSKTSAFCFCFIHLLVCWVIYLLILNKDWCNVFFSRKNVKVFFIKIVNSFFKLKNKFLKLDRHRCQVP